MVPRADAAFDAELCQLVLEDLGSLCLGREDPELGSERQSVRVQLGLVEGELVILLHQMEEADWCRHHHFVFAEIKRALAVEHLTNAMVGNRVHFLLKGRLNGHGENIGESCA